MFINSNPFYLETWPRIQHRGEGGLPKCSVLMSLYCNSINTVLLQKNMDYIVYIEFCGYASFPFIDQMFLTTLNNDMCNIFKSKVSPS
jgi:hypothetical protein